MPGWGKRFYPRSLEGVYLPFSLFSVFGKGVSRTMVHGARYTRRYDGSGWFVLLRMAFTRRV